MLNNTKKNKTSVFTLILCVLISFAGIYNHELWTPDEPREAAITLEMSKTGDFTVPHLAGEPFVEKPPLYYIIGATAIRTLSESINPTWTLRTISALLGLLALLFVFGIGHRCFGKAHALTCTLALATMPGFIYATHRLQVDNALLFFTVGTIYFFTETYIGKREHFVIPAGAMLAGAFLSKGLIGLALIFPGWLALFLPWAVKTWSTRPRSVILKQTAIQATGFLIFLALCSIWITAFRRTACDQLWTEWFWVNHFGRFKGQATHLGHIRGPFYYVPNFILHTLPWFTCIIISVITAFGSIAKLKNKNTGLICMLAWGICGMIMLTMSSTKREIYMLPLLPAFAILSPIALESAYRKTAAVSLSVWTIMCITTLIILSAISLAARFVPETFALHGVAKPEILSAWGVSSYVAAGGVLACIALLFTKNTGLTERHIAITALTMIILLNTTLPVLDLFKNYKHGFMEFSKNMGEYTGLKIAAWNLDETTRAGFYYYSDMVFPQITDEDELHAVISGEHPEFGAVIIRRRRSPTLLEQNPDVRILQSTRLGRDRVLKLLAGQGAVTENGN